MKQKMYRNQVHPPLSKEKRVDKNGNYLRRLWLKDGNTTMLFVNGLTEPACKALINNINTMLMRLGKKALSNKRFLITR